jgi:alkylation response protein AidB-like acyl-CoA dehydrogenase
MRKVPVAVIATLAVQTAGALVWAGGAAARISVLEGRMGEHRLVAERLARLEEQSKATRAAVERIELRLEAN